MITQIDNPETIFQSIVEASTTAIVLIDSEGKIVYVNKQTVKLFGYSQPELISREIEILVPPRFRSQFPADRASFFKFSPEQFFGVGTDLFALRKNETEFPVEISINPISTASGGNMAMLSVIDITDRKKAEDQIIKEKMLSDSVIEALPEVFYLFNSEGKMLRWNKNLEIRSGYSANEIGQINPLDFFPDDEKQLIAEKIEYVFTNGKSTVEAHMFTKNKQKIPYHFYCLLGTYQNRPCIIGVAADITDRKKHEAVLKAKMELEMKNMELEQFNYIASHDLKEPLQTILNYITMLFEDHAEQLDDEAKQYFEIITQTAQRMNRVVKGLLDFSRLGRNKATELVNLNAVLKEILSDLDGIIKTRRAKITIHNLPSLNGFETELRQLFQNLISNAIKFTKIDVAPQIEVGCVHRGYSYEFYIKDNGIGIDEKYFEKVFQIFQRLNSVHDYEGDGIGLANCKKIVDVHGGKIWVESKKGKGSIFKFTLYSIIGNG